MSTEMLNNDQVKIFNNKKQVDPEKFTKETVFVNLWKSLSWFLLMGIGGDQLARAVREAFEAQKK